MADDHINLASTTNGELFAAVKTSFDTASVTRIGLLRRHTDGTWDPMYQVDTIGTRPIVVINEVDSFLTVLYSSDTQGGDVIYKESSLSNIEFGSRQQLLTGGFYKNVSSTGSLFVDDLVIVGSGGTNNQGSVTVDGVRLQRP